MHRKNVAGKLASASRGPQSLPRTNGGGFALVPCQSGALESVAHLQSQAVHHSGEAQRLRVWRILLALADANLNTTLESSQGNQPQLAWEPPPPLILPLDLCPSCESCRVYHFFQGATHQRPVSKLFSRSGLWAQMPLVIHHFPPTSTLESRDTNCGPWPKVEILIESCRGSASWPAESRNHVRTVVAAYGYTNVHILLYYIYITNPNCMMGCALHLSLF